MLVEGGDGERRLLLGGYADSAMLTTLLRDALG